MNVLCSKKSCIYSAIFEMLFIYICSCVELSIFFFEFMKNNVGFYLTKDKFPGYIVNNLTLFC